MSTPPSNRRGFLKQAGLGAGLVGSGMLGSPSPAAAAEDRSEAGAASRSKRKPLVATDVLVVGGGPAGIGAALGAARTGAKTLLIESCGFFGGIAAWSLGMPINQMRPKANLAPWSTNWSSKSSWLTATRPYTSASTSCTATWITSRSPCSMPWTRWGCKYLVHLSAVDTLMEGDRVTGVVVGTKQGLATISAKVVVDCTGDADVAYFAGAETMMETEEPRMPSTLLLGMANVTPEQIRRANIRKIAERARSKYPLIPKSWGLKPVSNCHHYWINHTGTRDIGQFDTTDPIEFSEAECVSRRQALQMTRAMREFGGEDLKNVELIATNPRIAVRETRRVKGGYVLTEEDAAVGRKFDDVVAWRSGYLDLMGYKFTKMMIHDVPYRSILPEKVDGLLTAGRCISATHVSMAAGKSMGNCVATGHAAGLAAAISARKGIVPRELKVAQLQDALRKDGVDLTMGGKIQENVSGDRRV